MAKPVEMPFRMWTRMGPKKHTLGGYADRRHLANTIELSVCGGDAAFLSDYFDHLFVTTCCSFLLQEMVNAKF